MPDSLLIVESSSASVQLSLREATTEPGSRLHHRKQPDGESARIWAQDEIAARVTDTIAAWQSWSELHQAYVGPWHDLVHHSGRVLQALSFQPTGAICAAPTTSLPESIGGTRNWDYRYSWVRDASLTIEALWVAACPDEANEFFDYITASAAGSLDDDGDLQIMFGIGGERDLTERELPHPARAGGDHRRCAPETERGASVSSTSTGSFLSAVHRLSDQLFDPVGRVGPQADPGKWETPPDLARRAVAEQFLGCARRHRRRRGGRRRTAASGRCGGEPQSTSCTRS